MNTKKIIISIIVLVVLLGGGVGLGYYINKKNATPTAVVTLTNDKGSSGSQTSSRDGEGIIFSEKNTSSNWLSVQLVLNSNNKVISVNFVNTRAEKIFANVDIKGKSVDEASSELTLALIKTGNAISFSSGINGTNNCIVELEVNCENTEQANKIKSSVVAKVDSTFDENGIYGAVKSNIVTKTTKLYDKYKTIAGNLHLQAYDFADKTEAEVLAMINERSKKFEDCAVSEMTAVENFYNNTVKSLKTIIENAETFITQAEENIANSTILSDEQKAELNKQIQEKKTLVKEKIAEIEKQLDEVIKQIKEDSKAIIKQYKEDVKTEMSKVDPAYKDYLKSFKDKKSEHIDEIKKWRKNNEN